MLLSRLMLACLTVLLASCGFTPAYQAKSEQQKTVMQEKLAAIEVMPMAGRMGQELRDSLEDELSPLEIHTAPKYRLYLILKKNTSPAAIEKDRRITRYNIVITANYTLKPIGSENVIDKGTLKVVASYDALDSRFSTFIAEDKTTSNAIKELAEQLSTRLMTTKLTPP